MHSRSTPSCARPRRALESAPPCMPIKRQCSAHGLASVGSFADYVENLYARFGMALGP